MVNPFGSSIDTNVVFTPIRRKENRIMAEALNRNEHSIVINSGDYRVLRGMGAGVCGSQLVEMKDKKFVMKSERDCSQTYIFREYVCYKIAESLGFKFVPPTYLLRNDAYEFFSVQMFADGFKTWNATPEKWIEKINRNLLSHVWLFDYLVGNCDRHGGNFMVNENGNAIAIDHSHTFNGFCRPTYDDYCNRKATLNEFAFRLNRAENLLKIVEDVLPNEVDNIKRHAASIVRNAFQTLDYFDDNRW